MTSKSLQKLFNLDSKPNYWQAASAPEIATEVHFNGIPDFFDPNILLRCLIDTYKVRPQHSIGIKLHIVKGNGAFYFSTPTDAKALQVRCERAINEYYRKCGRVPADYQIETSNDGLYQYIDVSPSPKRRPPENS